MTSHFGILLYWAFFGLSRSVQPPSWSQSVLKRTMKWLHNHAQMLNVLQCTPNGPSTLANARLVSIQILLPLPIFKLLPNFIFECYRPQTWHFYLFFPALFISGTHKVPGLKFKGGVGHVTMSCKGPIEQNFFQISLFCLTAMAVDQLIFLCLFLSLCLFLTLKSKFLRHCVHAKVTWWLWGWPSLLVF